MKYCIVSTSLLTIALSAAAQTSPLGAMSRDTGLLLRDDVVRALIHESSGDRAHQSVQQLSQWARDAEPGYSAAALWVKDAATASGLKDVQLEVMAPHPEVDIKKGELWGAAPYRFKITSYQDQPMALAQGSTAAKLKNVQLIDIGAGLADSDYAAKDIKGKLVLTSSAPQAVRRKAIREHGALGVVSSYTTPPWNQPNRMEGDFPDQVGWASIGQAQNADDNMFAFMISNRRARELQSMMGKRDGLKVDVDIESSQRDARYQIVSGVIPGTKYPNEEIIITSHLDHYRPGANDNGSGSAATLEIIRTFNQLIEAGTIPRPLRTLRFLWLPEFSGTRDWFARHRDAPVKRIANLNIDMVGASIVQQNSSFSINYTPARNASFLNAVAESTLDFMNRFNASAYPERKDFHIISVNGTRDPLRAFMEPYTRGSDHQLFNDAGIPGIAFVTWPDDAYHSSEDRPDTVDPTQLHRAVFTGLAMIAVVAYADDADSANLVRLVQGYGMQRLAKDELRALRRIGAADGANLARENQLARTILRQALQRERDALASCIALAPRSQAALLRSAAYLNDAETGAMKRLAESAKSRARELGVTLTEARPDPQETTASRMVPVPRNGGVPGSLNQATNKAITKDPAMRPVVDQVLSALNTVEENMRAEGHSELRFYQMGDAIASYADGKRSILEIRDAVFAEYDYPVPLDTLTAMFSILEKAEAVSIKRK